jgi:hypothetical protein
MNDVMSHAVPAPKTAIIRNHAIVIEDLVLPAVSAHRRVRPTGTPAVDAAVLISASQVPDLTGFFR